MKITIAYHPSEESQAGAILLMCRHLLGKVKVKHTDSRKPYKHIYISKTPPATTEGKIVS